MPRDFAEVNKDFLIPFIVVCETKGVYNKNIIQSVKSKNKGKVSDFVSVSELGENVSLFEWAHKICTKPIIAEQPQELSILQPSENCIHTPAVESISSTITPAPTTPEWIDNVCKYI